MNENIAIYELVSALQLGFDSFDGTGTLLIHKLLNKLYCFMVGFTYSQKQDYFIKNLIMMTVLELMTFFIQTRTFIKTVRKLNSIFQI